MIELLVVVAIIGVLAGLLLGALAAAQERARSARCMSNLRQIGLATRLYADEHDDQYHQVNGEIPDQGQWTANPWSERILSPDDPAAYWGVAYAPYSGGSREIFRCPSARQVDAWREEGLPFPNSFWMNSTYGINQFVVRPYDTNVLWTWRIGSLPHPQSTVLAQDAAEQRMEGPEDSLGLFPGRSEILTQWRYDLQNLYPEREMWLEWFRHGQKCNTLYVDSHVAIIPFHGFAQGVDYHEYTGQ